MDNGIAGQRMTGVLGSETRRKKGRACCGLFIVVVVGRGGSGSGSLFFRVLFFIVWKCICFFG